ncbi:MAG: HD domain-containing protein [Candidatus Margulisbacteria bacterium]|nr:HD domain-containing protein [Candidatus Margulisiibacteriota bacterium]
MRPANYPAKIFSVVKLLLTARLRNEDIAFIREYLNKQEQILFYTLSAFDQKHSLNVAYTLRDWLGKRSKLRLDKIYKAALLHDAGKARAKLRLRDRVGQTLLFYFLSPLANYLADRGSLEHRAYWRRVLYVCKYHPRIGAMLAREIKTEEGVVYLIEHHRDRERLDEPKELTMLREADELN